jgi:hydroxymethylglutaryl-CoA lyase
MGGLGGQPANFLDDCPVKGTGDYYYKDPRFVGLVTLEDTLVQIDEMGIKHGWDVDRVLVLGKQLEKTFGRKLRSEAIINGRTQKDGHPEYARPGLARAKEANGETAEQKFPADSIL